MNHKQQASANFFNRMQTTYNLSISPLTILRNLFTKETTMDYDFVTPIKYLIGILASPWLLLAAPVTVGLGLIAGIAQTLFFPVQFIAASFKDALSSSKVTGEKQSVYTNTTESSDAKETIEMTNNSLGKHHPPLFSARGANTTNDDIQKKQNHAVSL